MLKMIFVLLCFESLVALDVIHDVHHESQRLHNDDSINRKIIGPRDETKNHQYQDIKQIEKDKSHNKNALKESCKVLETCRINTCIYLCLNSENEIYTKYILQNLSFEEAYIRRLELSDSTDFLQLELPKKDVEYKVKDKNNKDMLIKYVWENQNTVIASLIESSENNVIGKLIFEKIGDEIIIYDFLSHTK